MEENGLGSKHNKAKWSVYLPHDIALLNPLFCHTFSGCICCYAAHTESPLFLKRRLIVAQSVCPLRHGERNFQYYLAVKRKTCCGVFIFCYPDYWIEVVTHPEGPGTGWPSRHTLDFFVSPLSASRYSDGSQDAKLLLHASHKFFPFKVTELMLVSVMVTKIVFF